MTNLEVTTSTNTSFELRGCGCRKLSRILWTIGCADVLPRQDGAFLGEQGGFVTDALIGDFAFDRAKARHAGIGQGTAFAGVIAVYTEVIGLPK